MSWAPVYRWVKRYPSRSLTARSVALTLRSPRAIWLGLLFAGLLFQGPPALEAQSRAVVSLPQSPLTRIPSPDRKWTLIFECPNNCATRKLWIENSASHQRRLINTYERSLEVSWSPDGALLFVNDRFGSNGTLCYIYDAVSLTITDVADLVTSGDPGAMQFLKAGHSYLAAKHWVNAHEVTVVLYGHFDEPPPARGFELQYRVGTNGSVHRLKRRIF